MLIVDGEFSGLSPERDSIVSLGALDFHNPDNRFYEECRIWDGAHVNPESLEINGFTEAEIRDPNKQTEAKLIEKFLAWSETLPERTITGQNPSLDRNFLQSAAHRAGLEWPFAFRTIDTHTLCYMHMVQRGKNPPYANHRSALDLDAVLNYVGIPKEPEPHNALTGALSHAEVASRLLYDKKLLPEFEEFDIPWQK